MKRATLPVGLDLIREMMGLSDDVEIKGSLGIRDGVIYFIVEGEGVPVEQINGTLPVVNAECYQTEDPDLPRIKITTKLLKTKECIIAQPPFRILAQGAKQDILFPHGWDPGGGKG